MQIVIDFLDKKIKKEERRVKTAYYLIAKEASIKMEIEEFKNAVKILKSE